jgi:hypothetical protein
MTEAQRRANNTRGRQHRRLADIGDELRAILTEADQQQYELQVQRIANIEQLKRLVLLQQVTLENFAHTLRRNAQHVRVVMGGIAQRTTLSTVLLGDKLVNAYVDRRDDIKQDLPPVAVAAAAAPSAAATVPPLPMLRTQDTPRSPQNNAMPTVIAFDDMATPMRTTDAKRRAPFGGRLAMEPIAETSQGYTPMQAERRGAIPTRLFGPGPTATTTAAAAAAAAAAAKQRPSIVVTDARAPTPSPLLMRPSPLKPVAPSGFHQPMNTFAQAQKEKQRGDKQVIAGLAGADLDMIAISIAGTLRETQDAYQEAAQELISYELYQYAKSAGISIARRPTAASPSPTPSRRQGGGGGGGGGRSARNYKEGDAIIAIRRQPRRVVDRAIESAVRVLEWMGVDTNVTSATSRSNGRGLLQMALNFGENVPYAVMFAMLAVFARTNLNIALSTVKTARAATSLTLPLVFAALTTLAVFRQSVARVGSFVLNMSGDRGHRIVTAMRDPESVNATAGAWNTVKRIFGRLYYGVDYIGGVGGAYQSPQQQQQQQQQQREGVGDLQMPLDWFERNTFETPTFSPPPDDSVDPALVLYTLVKTSADVTLYLYEIQRRAPRFTNKAVEGGRHPMRLMTNLYYSCVQFTHVIVDTMIQLDIIKYASASARQQQQQQQQQQQVHLVTEDEFVARRLLEDVHLLSIAFRDQTIHTLPLLIASAGLPTWADRDVSRNKTLVRAFSTYLTSFQVYVNVYATKLQSDVLQSIYNFKPSGGKYQQEAREAARPRGFALPPPPAPN